VKEAASVFGLIKDPFDETKIASYETMRLLRYAYLHHDMKPSRNYLISDINKSSQL
jgi:hypothetical protein